MTSHSEHLKATYNRIAEDWFSDHGGDEWWIPGAAAFARLLRPGSTVVDIGCGAGQKTKYFLEQGFRVMATDISEQQIAITKREAPGADYHVLDLYHQADLGQQVDGLFLQAVLLHVPKREVVDVMRSMLPLLKPKGCVYIAVKEQRPGGVEEEMKVENDYGYEYQRFFSYFTMAELRELMRSLSLTIRYENIVAQPATNWLQIIGQQE